MDGYFENLLNCEEPTDISMAIDEMQRRCLPSTFTTRNQMAD